MKLWNEKTTPEMIFCNPKNPIIEVLHIILWQVGPKLIFVMSAGSHLGFMQITKIAQSGRKGNQTGIVLGPPKEYKS